MSADPLEPVRAALQASTSGAPVASRLLCHGPRGAGRTWWLDRAAALAAAADWEVARVAGSADRQTAPLHGLAALLAPFMAEVAALGPAGDLLRGALSGAATADPADLRHAALLALTAIADRRPLWIAVDDIDLLDSSSRAVLDSVLERCTADPIVLCATAVLPAAVPASTVVRLEPLSDATVAGLLTAAGVAPAAATRCAAAAGGNPGVAMAMADALSAGQRAGLEPVADLPRVAGALATELQGRMRQLGERCCRALVLAAAVTDGEVGAVDGALRHLGEPGIEALEPAEEAGVVELVGTRVVFPDAFTRHAAYHLVAPASRRAAHRALAGQFAEPHQAASRVWHLVGAAAGPSDTVAEALELVAADALRRGAAATALRTFERAVEFAATTEVRERALAAAVGAALDDTDLHHAERLVQSTVARTEPLLAAGVAVRELVTGRIADAEGSPVAAHVAARRLAWAAARAGDHRLVLTTLGEAPRHPFDVVPVAVALRHAGRTRDARDLLSTVDGERATGSFIAAWAKLVRADLDVLAGREPQPEALALGPTAPEWLRVQAEAVAARARLMATPAAELASEPAAWADLGEGDLAAVRDAIRAAVLQANSKAFDPAIHAAEHARLPVETGEARLWQILLLRAAGETPADDATSLALATLQRCGVRAWDHRAAATNSAMVGSSPRQVDSALDALSPSERRVADAVGEGMTNREAAAALFLSVKTVDFHLQQIYRKLGVRSRTELAVRVAGATPRVGAR